MPSSALSSAPHRPLCARCLRPQSACICQWIRPLANQVEVLILQHPLEVGHAKGSARLLHLSLARSRLQTGEIFAPAALQAMLEAPWPESGGAPAHCILLYPPDPAEAAHGMPPRLLCLPAAALAEPTRLRLVLLDGTWRQSRRMLVGNPLLQALPRLALPASLPSRYLVRRAQRPGQLSTLEACCHALQQLERREQPYPSLLQAFDGFVAQQLAYRQPSAPSGRRRQD